MTYTEIWKDAKGYKDLYQVSNMGRVRSLDKILKAGIRNNPFTLRKGKVLKPQKDVNGYLICCLTKNGAKSKRIHRLAIEAFIPKVEGKKYCNHKNGIKTDNRADNLEWCTLSENVKHAYKLGLMSMQGEKHSQCKLNNKKVRVIKHLKNINPNLTQAAIGKLFEVDQSLICRILSNNQWDHVNI